MMAEEIKHKWIKGDWIKSERHSFFSRDDECALCSCLRCWIKFNREGKQVEEVTYYMRSGQIFGNDQMPGCWGAKNPE